MRAWHPTLTFIAEETAYSIPFLWSGRLDFQKIPEMVELPWVLIYLSWLRSSLNESWPPGKMPLIKQLTSQWFQAILPNSRNIIVPRSQLWPRKDTSGQGEGVTEALRGIEGSLLVIMPRRQTSVGLVTLLKPQRFTSAAFQTRSRILRQAPRHLPQFEGLFVFWSDHWMPLGELFKIWK